MVIKIPLVRPSLPDPRLFIPVWQEVTEATGQYSNFGKLWHMAAEKLEELTGRKCFPCSSGTEAVALAAAATQAEYRRTSCAVEAFTFEAGRVAAQRAESVVYQAEYGIREVRSTESEQGIVVIRTIPFGSHRSFTGRQFDKEHTVVDAAGAFGPGAFKSTVRETQAIAVSFHATKQFPIGEGGAVLLPSAWKTGQATVMRAMNFGFDSKRSRPDPSEYATNAKLDELRCAMLLAQLERVDHFRARSLRIRKNVLTLIDRCSNSDTITAPYQMGAWQSLVVVGCRDAARLGAHLEKHGIASRRVYQPCPRPDLLLPQERELLALPSDCTDDEIEHVAAVINDAWAEL